MPETPCKFFLTTPIYYVNARPHIGHAYTTIVADVLARRSRAQGVETWFLTGTDEHGQKIERSAQAAGVPPQAFADEVSQSFQTLWKRMGITNDQFIRTTDPAHKRGVQKLFADLHARGQIYLSSYTGQYSIGEEMFIEGPPGTLGPDGKPTETVTEENFFFRLSDYQLPLLDLIESDTLKITHEARKNEVLSFLRGPIGSATSGRSATAGAPSFAESHPAKGGVSDEVRPLSLEPIEPVGPNDLGPSPSREPEPTTSAPTSGFAFSALGNPYLPGTLRDLSVSRSSFTWGIPVPEPAASEAKEKHVIYVWLDALANYMTALGYGSDSPEAQAHFQKFWPADLHLVGKEIIRFHCVYWPAFLLAAGLPLPKAVTAHGWLLFDDSKMSKSKGNIVRTETILSAFGTLCPPPTAPTPLHGVILSEAKNLSSSPEAPQTSPEAASLQTAQISALLKGTPSGVPPHPPTEAPASAAEVRSPLPDPQSPGAPFISQSHREMSGTSEASPTPSGTSDNRGAGEQGGVSSEARPLSSTPDEALKGRGFSPAAADPTENRALAPEGIPGDEAKGSASHSSSPQPVLLKGTPSGVPSHPPTPAPASAAEVPSSSPSAPSQKGGSSGLQSAESSAAAEGASAPTPPLSSFRSEAEECAVVLSTPTQHQRDLFAADVLRYFLLREIPFGQDGSFTFEALITRYNADLANGYGNLVSRTLKMIQTYFGGSLPDMETDMLNQIADFKNFQEKLNFKEGFTSTLSTHFDEREFDRFLQGISVLVKNVDEILSTGTPWKARETADATDRNRRWCLYFAAESIRIITALLHPILPYATASVWRQLGLGDIEQAAASGELKNLTWGGLKPGTKLGPLAPIFPRADKGLAQIMANIEEQQSQPKPSPEAPDKSVQSVSSVLSLSPEPAPTDPAAGPRTATLAEPNPGQHVAGSSAHTTERPGTPSHTEAPASGIFAPAAASGPADSSPQITIDDFAKVELRVAKILVCERIPKADKLLRLEVDLGYEQRQILSGIAEWYTPEDLIGRRIVVITNLAPRKMRGLESHGMLLAASTEGGKPHLATFAGADDLPLGSRLK